MQSVFLRILNMSAAASFVIIAIVIARLPLRKAPKKWSYLLWAAAGFRLACPVSISSVISLFRFTPARFTKTIPGSGTVGLDYIPSSIAERAAATAAPVPGAAAPASAVPFVSGLTTAAPAVTSAPTVTTAPVASAAPEVSAPVITAAPSGAGTVVRAAADPVRTVFTVLAIVWLVGVAAMLAYSIICYVKTCRRVDSAIRGEGNVYRHDEVLSPFILGFIRPRIYVPFGLDGKRLEYVLAHERTHLRRLDHIINAFAFLLLSLHWFNPLVWIGFRLMNRDMEMSCDESVLSEREDIGGEYSSTLLSFAVKKRFPVPEPLAFGESAVKSRIKNALNYRKPKLAATVIAALLTVAFVAACAVNPIDPADIEASQTPAKYYLLKDETPAPRETAQPFTAEPGQPEAGPAFVSNGRSHYMIKSDNSLWAWGKNDGAQLGDGTTEDRSSPVHIADNVLSVQLGLNGSVFAVTADGRLLGWGSTVWGDALWSGAENELRLAPVVIAHDVSKFRPGETCYAIRTDGTLLGWGADRTLGGNGGGFVSEPVELMTGVIDAAADSTGAVFALRGDGKLWAWGNNANGQLGDGTRTNTDTPVFIMDNVQRCWQRTALDNNGTLWAWGAYDYSGSLTPAPIMEDVLDYIPGRTSFVIKKDGSLWYYDTRDPYGQLERPDATNEFIKRLDGVSSVRSDHYMDEDYGYAYSLALQTNGDLTAFGSQMPGMYVPEDYSGGPTVLLSGVASFETDDGWSLFAVKTDGTLWAAGFNGTNPWAVEPSDAAEFARLGDGTTVNREEFVPILDNVVSVSTHTIIDYVDYDDGTDGYLDHCRTYALRADGTLWGWGWNGDGALGTGNTEPALSPVLIDSGIRLSGN